MPFLLVGIRLRAADIGIMLPLRVGCLLHLDAFALAGRAFLPFEGAANVPACP